MFVVKIRYKLILITLNHNLYSCVRKQTWLFK